MLLINFKDRSYFLLTNYKGGSCDLPFQSIKGQNNSVWVRKNKTRAKDFAM